MKVNLPYTGMLAGLLAGMLVPVCSHADEFLALPGLWKTTYEMDGTSTKSGEPTVIWHCVDEEADPWDSYAQLHDLPGMTCSRTSMQRNSTSLKWKMVCRGPGPDEVADVVEASGAILFDSSQHYTGWVKFTGTLLGYPLQSSSKIEGLRKAACTSPSD